MCEVCGAKWRGKWRVPDPRDPKPAGIPAARIRSALDAAYFRTTFGQNRPMDIRLLSQVGIHFPGPWSQVAKKLAKEELRRQQRKEQPGCRCAVA